MSIRWEFTRKSDHEADSARIRTSLALTSLRCGPGARQISRRRFVQSLGLRHAMGGLAARLFRARRARCRRRAHARHGAGGASVDRQLDLGGVARQRRADHRRRAGRRPGHGRQRQQDHPHADGREELQNLRRPARRDHRLVHVNFRHDLRVAPRAQAQGTRVSARLQTPERRRYYRRVPGDECRPDRRVDDGRALFIPGTGAGV